MSDAFCPYCGQVNSSEFHFCRRCGKPLPPLEAPELKPSGSSSPALPVSPPTPTPPPPPPPIRSEPIAPLPSSGGVEESALSDRPLSGPERAFLKQSLKQPGPAATRLFGSLFGFAPLFLIFMGLMGTSFPTESYTYTVLGTAIVGFAFGIASASFRGPVYKVLSRGTATEACGVPERLPDASAGRSRIRLGDSDFLLGGPLAGSFFEGRMNKLAYVDLGAGKARASVPGWKRVVLVGINGAVPPTSQECYVPENAAVSGASLDPPGPALKGAQ